MWNAKAMLRRIVVPVLGVLPLVSVLLTVPRQRSDGAQGLEACEGVGPAVISYENAISSNTISDNGD